MIASLRLAAPPFFFFFLFLLLLVARCGGSSALLREGAATVVLDTAVRASSTARRLCFARAADGAGGAELCILRRAFDRQNDVLVWLGMMWPAFFLSFFA
jgi:hypothetical protein